MALAAFSASPAPAQTRSEAAKAQREQIQPTVESGVRAADAASLGGTRSITFDEVLASPDDAALNLRYAQSMIEAGRLDVASATLERILILHPGLDRIRLLYAIVLFRLDNIDEAEAEFRLLQKRDLRRRDAKEVARYLGIIENRQKRGKGAVTFTAGMHYDSNRNAFPKDGILEVLSVPVSGLGDEENDIGWLTVGTLEYRYDTHLQRAREVFFNGTVYSDEQVEHDNLDTLAFLLDGGPGLRDRFPHRHAEAALQQDLPGQAQLRRRCLRRPQAGAAAAGARLPGLCRGRIRIRTVQ